MPKSRMTTAFVPEDPTQQALIASALQEAGITYITRNAGVQNLVGIRSFLTGGRWMWILSGGSFT